MWLKRMTQEHSNTKQSPGGLWKDEATEQQHNVRSMTDLAGRIFKQMTSALFVVIATTVSIKM